MIRYLVSIPQEVLGIHVISYVKHAFSYKKGLKGVVLCIDQDQAHSYKSKESAESASVAYNGLVKTISGDP